MDEDPEQTLLIAPLLLDALYSNATLAGEALLFCLLMIVSFFASGSEVALFSIPRSEAEQLRENPSIQSRRISSLLSAPQKLLATILITNNFVNVTAILVASDMLATFAERYQWDEGLRFFLEVFLITSLILFFGEIIPKVYASRHRQPILKLAVLPVSIANVLFSPLSFLLIRGTRFIDRYVRIPQRDTSLEDLRTAVDIATVDAPSERDENEIISAIINFSNIPVKSIMRARVDMMAVEIGMSFDELLAFIRENRFSRMPVYEESLDQIRGILHIKDLLPYLRGGAPPDLASLIRPPYFVPESKKIDMLLEEFQQQRLHMAIVVDEFGGTAGLVTLEDVIEEILGEINDEFDSEDWTYTQISEREYVFEGRILLHDLKKILDLDDEAFDEVRGDADSLGGLILELHGKIPQVGDQIRYQDFVFTIESISRNRIAQVKLVRETNEEDEDEGK